jgi:hypothetical protein
MEVKRREHKKTVNLKKIQNCPILTNIKKISTSTFCSMVTPLGPSSVYT